MIRIEHIDDVLPQIPPDVGIVVSERRHFTVIDYVYTVAETFQTPMTRECRGLKFGPDGRILARPFHKFFNVGEREQIQDVAWDRPHVVLDKLDGSMVHPCLLGGRLVFMTRMGVTEQAEAALAAADHAVIALCEDALAAGVTPMFEFTSPDHRIVVAYDRPALTLLAARETISGAYLPYAELAALADRHGVALVQAFGSVDDPQAFVADARALHGAEGYVIAFEDGHRLKLKADAYVLRHKALAGVAYEKNLLAWFAEDAMDDVLALLRPDVAARVAAYRDRVQAAFEARLAQVSAFVAGHRGVSRRAFALAAQSGLDPRLKPIAFAMLDGRDGRQALLKLVRWAAHSENRLDQVRDLFDMAWSGAELDVEAA